LANSAARLAAPTHEANADTGTTGHYIALKDINCLTNVQPVTDKTRITVTLPTGEEIGSTHTGDLKYSPHRDAQRVHVFKSLWGSLLGIGDLCDIGLTAVFTKTAVYMVDTDADEVVLTGRRDKATRLWMIALTPISPREEHNAVKRANVVKRKHPDKQKLPKIHLKKAATDSRTQTQQDQCNAACKQTLDTAGDRVEYFSRVFCSPAESTLINAVKKGWIQYPHITANVLKRHRHRLRTHESAAGHLDQVHQNQHRRQLVAPTPDPSELQPTNVLTQIYSEGNHMDATGRFPAISTKGNQYILVMISEGTNYIKCIPIPSRTKHSYLKAHQEALQFYEEHGCKPTFQRMDNETSNAFMEHLRTNKITIDHTTPA
jgi:hypothetical protein